MAHEINMFEIPDRRLLADDVKSRVVIQTDIGVARVTRTIFGTAKVRVIRKQDKVRRTGLLVALVVTVMSAAGWQGWVAMKQTDQIAHPQLDVSAKMQVSAPNFQPDFPLNPITPASSKNDPKIFPKTTASRSVASPKPIVGQNAAIVEKPVISRNDRQPKSADLKPAAQIAAKPVRAAPVASKPPAKSIAENNSQTNKPADVQSPAKLSLPLQPAVPAVAATPVASTVAQPAVQPAMQPPANNPAPAVAPAQPAAKEIAAAESAVGSAASGGDQPAAAASVPSPANLQH